MTTNNQAVDVTEGFERLRLENQLCFALYAATRLMTRTYRERLTPLGLTYPQYLVLIVLWENDGLTLTAIGKRLMLDSGTLTPLVRRLETQGLVERRRGTKDEREVFVHLTEAGQSVQGSALEARCFLVARLGMTEEELKSIRVELMGLVNRLNVEAGEMNEDCSETI